jgi:hypothetical protein
MKNNIVADTFDDDRKITLEIAPDSHSARCQFFSGKEHRVVSRRVKPQRDATRCIGVSLSSSSRFAASTRGISMKSAGVVPVSSRNTRVRLRTLMASRVAYQHPRRTLPIIRSTEGTSGSGLSSALAAEEAFAAVV